ncbi:hypothetical protein SEMRO_2580_G331830.1 [Seminavis robusta]|uniref:Uncharacterized protein n=1 Tax=Seminavis robusta TaxID=568900 RepID=A0A9N8EWX2_9STRA|nr:hypothetical protein SEMRO_2580_G331830.1 [Seminavis robusta]|eukprot:Sro2580_g331830.1 n/a (104) ;mRNA; f:4664-4975
MSDTSTSIYFFFSTNVNLRTFLTMADFLTNKSVRRGYVVLRRKESEVTMALEVCDNEIDPTVFLEGNKYLNSNSNDVCHSMVFADKGLRPHNTPYVRKAFRVK